MQKEFPELKKRYWGKRLWARGYVVWSTGNLTDELVQSYLEHHRRESDKRDDNFLLCNIGDFKAQFYKPPTSSRW